MFRIKVNALHQENTAARQKRNRTNAWFNHTLLREPASQLKITLSQHTLWKV